MIISLDQSLAADQVLQVLVSLLVLLLFLDCFRDDVSQLGSIEEGTSVLQDVVGPVVKDLSDKERNETHELGVLAEVQLILDAQFKLKLQIASVTANL